jgi:AraC-like DNA-binding protein
MKLRSIHPHAAIANYINSIVVLESDVPGAYTIPLVAKGCPSIVFQVTGQGIPLNRNNLVLYGQNIKPIDFTANGDVLMIAYFLHPHILKPFFGFDANEVTDQSIDLSALPTARSINLKEQLLNAVSLNARLQLMDSYVLKLASLARSNQNEAIVWATQAIQKYNGLVSLQFLQNELHTTERTFQRMFKMHIGVSPKTFNKIIQFQQAFQQFSNGQFSKLGDIAYQNGYFDQSHFIRDFRDFTSVSPSEYLKRIAELQSLIIVKI